VNCRLVPGERQDHIIEAIRQVIADPAVEIAIAEPATPSDPSVLPSGLRHILERLVEAQYGRFPVIPYMEMGATDGVYLRNAGIPVFGIIGLFAPQAALQSVHANDERVPAAAYDQMVAFTGDLVRRIAASDPPR
jgi:acetylornithine deacetylase/succinyl-diaminopimelate desuccinylase-like protein